MHAITKRLSAWILALTMLASLTACADGGSGGGQQPTGDSEAPSTAAPAAGATLTFGGPSDWFDESVMSVLEAYQEQTGVDIDVQLLSTQSDTIIQTKLATNECYDMFFQHGGGYAYTWFRPQVNCIDLSDEPWAGKINQGIRDSMLDIDGKLYFLPFGVNSLSLIYNKEIYAELGMSIPQTWDEMLANCETAQSAGYLPFYVAAKDVWPITAWPFAEFSFAIQRDPDLMEKINTNQLTFSDVPELENSGRRFQEVKALGYFQEGELSSTYDQAVEAFGSGQVATICIMDSFANDVVKKYPDLDFGGFPMPLNDDPVITAINPRSMFIWKGTDKLDTAKDLLTFIADEENYLTIMEGNPSIPCMDGIDVELNPVARDYLPYREMGNFITIFEELIVVGIDESLREACQDVLAGADPSELGRQMDNAFQKNAKAQRIEGF